MLDFGSYFSRPCVVSYAVIWCRASLFQECEISGDIRVCSVIPSFSGTDIVILAVELRARDRHGQASLRLPLRGYFTLYDINDL